MRVIAMVFAAAAATVLAAIAPSQEAQPDSAKLTLPAYVGYAHPDPLGIQRNRKDGSVPRCSGELRFYIEIATPGKLAVHLERLPGASACEFKVQSGPYPGDRRGSITLEMHASETTRHIGTVGIVEPGKQLFIVSATDGSPLTKLKALQLVGPAAVGAKASTVERRNASSVHLWYDVPADHEDAIEYFYCELTPVTDPLWTYYMATGWHRGYFGMQVNSETERRIIFSVWDSGSEAVDRKKVERDDLVQLVRKGKDVHAGGFGNEGTGGHSHLVHDWRLGDTVRFLVRAEPSGKHTTYTGWFQHVHADKSEQPDAWRLVASFRAPKDGRYLHGLYSFSENFGGANGDRRRECRYGNVWLRTKGGRWLPSNGARFTHDGHGNQHRLDRAGGTSDGRFVLRHGDFAVEPMRRNTRLQGRSVGKHPIRLPR
ncbi:MAG: DUF3472 domain-containing protein [Planctomycetota bacterium]